MIPLLFLALAPSAPIQDATPSAPPRDEAAAAPAAGERWWPQWRGPLGTGEAPQSDPPLEWSTEENVRWRVALPGSGHSTPVVWDERIFVTTAVPFGDPLEPAPDDAPGAHDNAPVTHRQRFEVLCLDRRDGALLWRTAVREELPHERAHYTAGFASASPVTDGTHVWAFFGSRGLYCLDLAGEVVWEKDLGDMQVKHAHGEAASPALFGDTLVVNWDHEGDSFVIAYDARTGDERWRAERDEVTSWATPIVVVVGDEPQLVVSGTRRLRGYDLATGAVVWECPGLSSNIVATPVAGDGMVFAGSSYEKQAMLGLRLAGARGDLSDTEHMVWYRRRATPYVPSPLLYDGYLWFVHHYQPLLTRIVAATGEEPDRPMRLDGVGNLYGSPVAAAGRVYLTDLEGTTVVLSAKDRKVLARNRLDDSFSASAVLVGREIYLRGASFLWCLAQEE